MKSGKQELILEINNAIFRIQKRGWEVCCVWVPAHVGTGGNEDADILAKQSLRFQAVNIQSQLNKTEGKSLIWKHPKTVARVLGISRYRQTLLQYPMRCGRGKEAWKESEGGGRDNKV